MVMAGFADVWATFGVFGCVEVAEVLELVIFFHVVKDGLALPVGCFEIAMFGALFGDLDFAVCLFELGIDFLLAFRTDAFGFTQLIVALQRLLQLLMLRVAASSTWLRCAHIYVCSQLLYADVNKRIAE